MIPTLLAADLLSVTTPLLVAFAIDQADSAPLRTSAPASDHVQPGARMLLHRDDAFAHATAAVFASDEFKASANETLLLHSPTALQAQRLLVIGLGDAKKIDLSRVRQAAGVAVRVAKSKSIRDVAIALPDLSTLTKGLKPEQVAQAVAEGVSLADFDADIYKSDRKDASLATVALVVPADSAQQKEVARALWRGAAIGESQNFARSLVLEPGNILTPTELGRRAKSLADEVGLVCDVHSTEFLREQRMHAFLAVAQGSIEPPALIVLRYEPEQQSSESAPVLALVGKGITFDTGGISIKPADGMEKMKYDMAGAAAMLGAMRAVALLKPAVRVLCIICSAENMPSGSAYKPGDVVTAMSGTTIEVMNTDAEGRMVLADGLHYARTLGATHLIDAATLTGACVVALGRLNAGLFSNDDAACNRFADAAQATGESFWRLPCTEEYRDLIKSQIADIQNTGVDRWGGAITAAMFLKEFVGDTPWVHLDIAGQAWIDDVRPYIAKGPSGVAVRSVLEWVRSYESAPPA